MNRLLVAIIAIMAVTGAYTVSAFAQTQPRRVIRRPAARIKIEPAGEAAEMIELAKVGESYKAAFIATGDGGSGLIWDHGVLPMGLVLQMDNMISGKIFIKGMPEEAGTYQIKIKATDVNDPAMSGSYSYTLKVTPHLFRAQ